MMIDVHWHLRVMSGFGQLVSASVVVSWGVAPVVILLNATFPSR